MQQNNIKVIIPISIGINIRPVVVDIIKLQSIPTEVSIISSPEQAIKKSMNYENNMNRINLISRARNLCLPELAKDDISVMQDSTVLHINNNNLKDMYDFLMANEDVVAVALKTVFDIAEPSYHIRNGCIMARKVVWESANFTLGTYDHCTCNSFTRQVHNLGKYIYLDNDKNRVIKILQ